MDRRREPGNAFFDEISADRAKVDAAVAEAVDDGEADEVDVEDEVELDAVNGGLPLTEDEEGLALLLGFPL